MNPFLKMSGFREAALTYPTNTTNSTVCGGLWKANGTCCDFDKALEQAQKKAGEVDKAAVALKDHLAKLKQFLDLRQNQINLTASKFAFLRRVTNQSLTNSIDKCWEHMKSTRASTYCFACSGDSQRYFAARSGKALISPKECGTMLSTCTDFFFEILNLTSGLQKLADDYDGKGSSSQAKAAEIKIESGEKLSKEDKEALENKWVKDLTKRIGDIDILSDLKKLTISNVSASVAYGIQVKICEYFFRLAKDTFIQDIKPLVEFMVKKMTVIFPSSVPSSRILRMFGSSRSLGKSTDSGVSSNSATSSKKIASSTSSSSGSSASPASNTNANNSGNGNSGNGNSSQGNSGNGDSSYHAVDSGAFSFASVNYSDPQELFGGDAQVYLKATDNIFTSFVGCESQRDSEYKEAMNLTMKFP